MSLSSMMGGLSSLSLSRSGNDDKERGRSEKKDSRSNAFRSSSFSGSSDAQDGLSARTRSQSPFRLRRGRTRDTSPVVEALSVSDAESDTEVSHIRPRNAFSLSATSDDESADEEAEDDEGSEESWSDDDQLDPVTERNTERNALIPADLTDHDTVDVPDPLGEGVNVVVPPEPYFPSTLNSSTHGPRRRKSVRPDPLHFQTSRPVFQRDRCTITITHGDPARVLEETGRKPKRYVLASDLSDESRYALEWGIGTVLRDGDEMLIVTVIENESKIDPLIPNPSDRATKLRSQQERQALAYILVRQATSLLQRTRLHVTVSCQAWHAKNSRHMLLDIVDYYEPTMLIVGSRGLGNLKGILLGSTSHYLIQKCSVPVMVARRRLKRPPRRSAHLAPHRARVSLAQAAGVDRVAPKVDQDVAEMRDQIERENEESRARAASGAPPQVEVEEDPDLELDDQLGRKVAGTE
ncbi:adenine nucleotide alpha hydrolases-like protein [Laetiporus sulphureus 93-53]|uniref:Adenine nucleotide alpha hydrolases-like protein n=1 Tax=Laetiporus sulphureus 93-53 TaxID=1314785 RepID=A0A165HSA2_9APHY|nr:adenine nucleotide alpha hydrolases-like protein [Laetiporus sulphureus 93-53]KZT12118.1 adenine nucleotide alpha hydrolases-like protein [Laetiporus sulphureus 93-53]